MKLSIIKSILLKSLFFGALAILPTKVSAAPTLASSQSESSQGVYTPRLLVEESDRYAMLSFKEEGGVKTLKITTNQGNPYVENLPSWLKIIESSTSGITFSCPPNNSPSKREADFYICAGDLSVKVHARQPTAGRLVIKNCEFINTDQYAETIGGPDSRMKASEIRYLNPVINYDGARKGIEKIIYVKIYDGMGHLRRTPNAPEGYSYRDKVTFNPGKDNQMVLMGLGRPNESIFTPGTVRVEIYCDDELLLTGTVDLY